MVSALPGKSDLPIVRALNAADVLTNLRPRAAADLAFTPYGHRRGQQIGPSMQADAPLASCVSQQAFKHETGIRVARVMAARVAPISKIPINGTGFGD